MTHTPGPWGYDGTGCVYSDALPKDDCVIAELLYADGDWEADGRLMAAAPEMLAALCEARDAFAALDWEGDENWRNWDATRVDSLIAGTLHVVNKAIGLTKEGSDGEDRRMD